MSWLFVREVEFDTETKGWNKSIRKGKLVPEILDGIHARFADVEWTAAALNDAVSEVGNELGARSQVVARAAITGTTAGIPLWDGVATLERDVVRERIAAMRELF